MDDPTSGWPDRCWLYLRRTVYFLAMAAFCHLIFFGVMWALLAAYLTWTSEDRAYGLMFGAAAIAPLALVVVGRRVMRTLAPSWPRSSLLLSSAANAVPAYGIGVAWSGLG